MMPAKQFYSSQIENLPKIEKKKSIFDTILSDGSDNNKESQSDDSKSDTNENEAEETEQHLDRPSWHFDVLPEPNRKEQHHENTKKFCEESHRRNAGAVKPSEALKDM